MVHPLFSAEEAQHLNSARSQRTRDRIGTADSRRDQAACCAVAGPGAAKRECSPGVTTRLRDDSEALPLRQMNTEERLVADYAGTGLTIFTDHGL